MQYNQYLTLLNDVTLNSSQGHVKVDKFIFNSDHLQNKICFAFCVVNSIYYVVVEFDLELEQPGSNHS